MKTIYDILNGKPEKLQEIINNLEKYYRSYPIKQLRWIDAPQGQLKMYQKRILEKFLYKFKPHDCAVGFVKHVSVVDGAKRHLGNKTVLCLDIADFFSSFKLYQVYAAYGFMLSKMCKIDPDFTYSKNDLKLLVDLTTYKGKIPQGVPTSPVLVNIICKPLDRMLDNLAKKYELVYTRYADDLTFSHKDKNYNMDKIIREIKIILLAYGLYLNPRKTRILRPHKRMSITGVVINEKLSTPKYVWRNIRAQLHNAIKENKKLSFEEQQKLRGKIEWVGIFRPQLKKEFLEQLGKVI